MIGKYHLDLTTITFIHRAWRIKHEDSVFASEPAAWANLTFSAGRQLYRNPRPYSRPLPRFDHNRFSGEQIPTCVAPI